jgi:hypothetical protein
VDFDVFPLTMPDGTVVNDAAEYAAWHKARATSKTKAGDSAGPRRVRIHDDGFIIDGEVIRTKQDYDNLLARLRDKKKAAAVGLPAGQDAGEPPRGPVVEVDLSQRPDVCLGELAHQRTSPPATETLTAAQIERTGQRPERK